MKTLHIIIASCLLMFLFSCKTQHILMQSKKEQRIQSVNPDSVFLSNVSYEYKVRRDDKLNISVWNNDDISVGSVFGIYNSSEGYGKWLMVDKNGEIALPELGSLKVEGLTVLQLKEILRKQISRTILNPIIDVKVLNKEVTVLGEVKNPGKHLLEKEDYTLLEVLGMSGDFDTYANKRKIQVIRTIDNKPNSITIDLGRMKDYSLSNIRIQPGDVVYVPSKNGKEWDKRAGATIIPAASAITTVILLLKLF
jgi:polysaccharide biosynthesis/export protein